MNRKVASLILVSILLPLVVDVGFPVSLRICGGRPEVPNNLDPPGPEFVQREIIVKFESNLRIGWSNNTVTSDFKSTDELKKQFEAEKVEKIFSEVYKLSFRDNADLISVTKELETHPNIEYVEPNQVLQTCVVPNDLEYTKQWAHQVIESEAAWDIETGSPDITIAVVDTGVDWDHPDLAANIWSNTDEVIDGRDTDGNGYIDDVRGYDFVDTDASVYQGEDGKTRDNDPMDVDGHGTHCAGIAAAVTDNRKGVAGVSWNCKIMAVRAGYKAADGVGYLENDDAALAIVYAADNGADIISMSWGDFEESALIHDALKYAYDKGVLLIAAAGNDATSKKHFPAAYDEVVAVTATDRHNGLPRWTNFGNWTELSAPGVDIYSTVPTHSFLSDGSYANKSGTSMSTPHVAGVAALIWSQFPNMTRDRVRRQLWFAADDLGDPGYDEYYGFGRINARRALEVAPPTHDLHMLSLDAPPGVKPRHTGKIKTTIANLGSIDETNVALALLINGTTINSVSLSSLTSGSVITISLIWVPSLEGCYNVTVYAMPVPGEDVVSNNVLSTNVMVREAKVLSVPHDFGTIQDAVDSAISGIGDIVYVESGIFHENVVVDKAVSLVGEEPRSTIIEGWVEIRANNVNISSFTLRSNNLVAVHLHLVAGCKIFNNTIADNRDGIYIHFSSDNTISGNNITNNDATGIGIWYSSNNTISGNNITNNWSGIYLRSSSNTTAYGNNLANNDYDFYLTYSLHNRIHHNNLLDNTNQVYTKDSVNNWDDGYPSGGNYWSDYTGIDEFSGPNQNVSGSDGIGDTPHLRDNYPLMGPFAAFSFIMEGVTHYVDVITNSSLSHFHPSPVGKRVDFRVTGPDSTLGFCRVTIPKIFLGESYTVSVDNRQPMELTETSDSENYYLYFTYSHDGENVRIAGTDADAFPGDTNNDGVVDIYDAVTVVLAFGTKLGDPQWNSIADINGDGAIDIYDLVSIASYFGKSV